MERAVYRGRWNKRPPVGTTLLLMSMFIPALTLLQPTEKEPCPPEDYAAGERICCNKCFPGFKLVEKCQATGQRSNCTPCLPGQYTDQMNFSPNCRSCRRCRTSKHEILVSPCERRQNAICRCEAGYYKFEIDSETSECRRCIKCGQDEKEKQTCTPEKNTECECTENYYKVRGKCEPCKNCTAECKHHCSPPPSQNTKGQPGNEYLINIIVGVVVVAVVALVLVVLITHMITKWLLKPKPRTQASTQPSDVTPDSYEHFLFHGMEPPDNMCVEAVPQSAVSEQEPSNLPDCVPLEVKIPDLIYTVLDLVPVQQMKQLVRSLGVKDTEIEQAETDHRSCREAHYQMLRVWAERGSRAGGGGRGRMLHWPLLQELLDELRKMHLGRAAEELETKYGIQ